jgi:hypothetical protein
LFRRSFPQALVASATRGQESVWAAKLAITPDVQISAASVPRLLRNSLDEFPQSSFLVPDDAKVARWRERFATLGNGLKIGISWKAGSTHRDRQQRGESLDAWRSLLSTSGAHFVSLQYGDVEHELQAFAEQTGIVVHAWKEADNTADVDGLAARMAALDMIISVGNTTAHLAGALGLPVWVLLPRVASWRWLEQNGTSIWYPSARLFRQNRSGDWGNLFERVGHDLLNRISQQVEEPKRGVLAPHVSLRSNGSQSVSQML